MWTSHSRQEKSLQYWNCPEPAHWRRMLKVQSTRKNYKLTSEFVVFLVQPLILHSKTPNSWWRSNIKLEKLHVIYNIYWSNHFPSNFILTRTPGLPKNPKLIGKILYYLENPELQNSKSLIAKIWLSSIIQFYFSNNHKSQMCILHWICMIKLSNYLV